MGFVLLCKTKLFLWGNRMKTALKKIGILITVIFSLMCSVSVFAEDNEHKCACKPELCFSFEDFRHGLHEKDEISMYSDSGLSTEIHVSGALENIRKGILSKKSRIIFDEALSQDDADVMSYALYNGFYNIWIAEYIENSRGNVVGVKLGYGDEFNLNEFKEFSKEVDNILYYIEPDMTDLEKAITVYDHMQQHYRYDTENYENGTIPYLSYRGYGIMLNKIGVCQAYAEAYQYLLSLLDIPCSLIVSWEMDHAWNVLYIDGDWYQADVTWDDGNVFGDVGHSFFLFSDEGAQSRLHEGWDDYGAECTNTQYDEEAPWSNFYGRVLILDGYWYYKDYEGIIKYSPNEKNAETLYSDDYIRNSFEYCNGKFYYLKTNFEYDVDTDRYLSYDTLCAVDAQSLEKTEISLPLEIQEHLEGFHICGKDIFYNYLDENNTIMVNSQKFVDNIFVRSISLDAAEEVYVGKNMNITADIKPLYADSKQLEWSVSDGDVAKITQHGQLTALKEGIVTVNAKTTDGSNIEKSIDIIVSEPSYVPVASVRADKTSGMIPKGSLVELSSDTVGATIYYTTDGSNPTEESNIYNTPIEITESATIKAIALKDGREKSEVSEFNYDVVIPQSMTVTLEDYAYMIWGSGNKELNALKFNVNNSEGAQRVCVILAIYDKNNIPVRVLTSEDMVIDGSENSVTFSGISIASDERNQYTARVFIFGKDYLMFPFGKTNQFNINLYINN